MASTRDLLIRLLGDSSGMKKALDEADGAVGKHDLSLKNLAGTIGSAYATAKVIEFGKASVEAAAADEASQVTLALALRNTAGASDEVIASAEAFIEKTMFATGVTDDELRPALERLTRATGDVGQAQDLLGVAMDVSAGTGKSLQAVTEAMGKAADGNVGALSRLGIATKDASGATLSFDQIVGNLSETFGGQAAAAADTQAGKLAIMKARYGELQEQVGSALMPIMEELVGVLSGVAEWFTSLDEGTQQWIIRIGMLGGGLVLATRAVNGIVGPLKSLGVIGGAASKAVDGVASSSGGLSSKMAIAAGPVAALGLVLVGLQMDAANTRDILSDLSGSASDLSRVSDEELAASFKHTIGLMGLAQGQGISLEKSMADLAAANLEGAIRLRDSGVAAGFSAELQALLEQAILDEQAALLQATATTEQYGASVDDAATTTRTAATSTRYWTDIVSGATTKLQENKVGVDTSAGSVSYWTDIVSGATDKTNSMKTAVAQLDNEYRALTGNLDQREAWLNLLDTMDAYKWKMNSGELSTRQQEQATIDAKQAVLGMIGSLKNVPAETKARLVSQVERGQLDETVRDIERITSRTHTATIRVNLTGGTTVGGLRFQARGGVSEGGLTVVGEEGPELVNMPAGAMVHTAAQTRRMLSVPSGVAGVGGAGSTVVINNHFNGPVMGEQDFIRKLEEGRQDAIRRGALLVSG